MPEDDPAPLPPSGYLDCMTMHHLRQLHDAVQALMAAGDAVGKAGFDPTFSLVAADGMTMAIDYRLPMPRGDTVAILHLGPELATPFSKPGAWSLTGARPIGDFGEIATVRRPGGMPPGRPSAPTSEPLYDPAPDPEQAADPMAAGEAQDSGGGGGMAAPAPVAAPSDELLGGERGGLQRQCLAEHDPVQAVAETGVAPEPAAAEAQPEPPAPGTARALVASARANAWTAEEDAQLIEAYAKALVAGQPKGAAIAEIAARLGRPVAGTAFRVQTKLADQIRDAIALLQAPAGPETLSAPSSGAADQAAEAASPDPAPAAARDADPAADGPAAAQEGDGAATGQSAPSRPTLPADLSPIEAHVIGMPRSGNWTIARDFALVEMACNGWDMPSIAAELGCDSAALRARFDRLTGLDPVTKTQRWGRDALREAFARLMPQEG